jgi:hypothetical protein
MLGELERIEGRSKRWRWAAPATATALFSRAQWATAIMWMLRNRVCATQQLAIGTRSPDRSRPRPVTLMGPEGPSLWGAPPRGAYRFGSDDAGDGSKRRRVGTVRQRGLDHICDVGAHQLVALQERVA